AGHQIRNGVFNSLPPDTIDTGEVFDCVVVGGGVSGLSAALSFKKYAGRISRVSFSTIIRFSAVRPNGTSSSWTASGSWDRRGLIISRFPCHIVSWRDFLS